MAMLNTLYTYGKAPTINGTRPTLFNNERLPLVGCLATISKIRNEYHVLPQKTYNEEMKELLTPLLWC